MGDRADRLNRRRQDLSQPQSDDAGSENPEVEPDSESGSQSQSEASTGSASDSDSSQQSGSGGSIKDQYKGMYIFLPEDLHQQFNFTASEWDLQRQRRNGKQVEKIRHFEPLMISLALEKAEELDGDEIEERLAEFDP